jgi:lipoprotein-anchoring transpeptidase ErfK/SrfK
MTKTTGPTGTHLTRRRFAGLAAGAVSAVVAAPALGQSLVPELDENGQPLGQAQGLARRISGWATQDWQPYFSNLRNGVVLVDTRLRTLHFWGEDGVTYRVYPTSVPLTAELTRTGRTSVVQKVVGPEWRPTPNMLKRNPTLPPYIGPGPENPLGTHALYLTWTYYRIHGTNDTRKIGRQSSNGCIGLYNEDIVELFELTNVGTQVMVI